MKNPQNYIEPFLLLTTLLIMGMGSFVIFIVYLNGRRQRVYQEKIKDVEETYEKNLLKVQLEIQEQTFHNISREIHDNINLSLTLGKLHLHTLDWSKIEEARDKVATAIVLLTNSITGLSAISQGLNADIIIQNGLLKAIEDEIRLIKKTGLLNIKYSLHGTPLYLDPKTELLIFRIIQEGINNILKHAEASNAKLIIQYDCDKMKVVIYDNGKGFDTEMKKLDRKAGLKNMETRIKILQGSMRIRSRIGQGTILSFYIPFEIC